MKRLSVIIVGLAALLIIGFALNLIWSDQLPFQPNPAQVADAQPDKVEVLDFYTTWCGPCAASMPTVKELIADGFNIRRVNAQGDEDERVLKDEYRIDTVPTFVVLVNGKEIYRTGSVDSLAQFLRKQERVSSIQTSESDVCHLPEAARQGATSKSQGGA